MKLNIRITAGAVQLDARLTDPMTAQTIRDTLPITAAANTWGDEINFVIPVESELERGQDGGAGRPGLLAARTRFLHLLWKNSGQPGG